MSLEDIPITRIDAGAEEDRTPWVEALLHELRSRVTSLLQDNEATSIDLSSLPLPPGGRDRLREVLGQGEVDARVDSLGETQVRETATPGLWWITHRNEAGEVLAEFLEITLCPEILSSSPDEVEAGLERLCTELGDPG